MLPAMIRTVPSLGFALALAGAMPSWALAAGDASTARRVEIVSTTPLPGLATPLEQVPANVQTFRSGEIEGQRTGGVAEFLNANANSVSLNSPTGNFFQPDLSFRGFTASALLGTPQGLSVFQDGVRINEAFADVVYWDLIPKNAVSTMQLLPGSNPVFGLNTLGGALTIGMKDGFANPGAQAEVSAGSFNRTSASAEAGGNDGRLGYFVAAEGIHENGWRDHSSTTIRRMYARGDMRTEHDDVSVALTLADNSLEGTQALPLSMLDDPQQPYTWPDSTENQLGFINTTWLHYVDADTVVATNAYYRRLRSSGVNSNVNGEYDPPTQPFEAFNLLTAATTTTWGASMQATLARPWGGVKHLFVAGVSVDSGSTDYSQSAQPAEFRNDREAVGIGDFDSSTQVDTRTRHSGAYLADTISLTPQWNLSLSGRYNMARVTTHDLTGSSPAIDGNNPFSRFNPALGLTWAPSAALTAFGGFSQGMRTPTAVELTCADPAAPCTLPNIFVADPPLQAVVSTTLEAGVRGRVGESGFYSAAIYRTDLDNDIQFIGAGSGAVNAGYFQNVGKTRRQGIELSGGARLGEVRLSALYSLLDATFQTAFAESSPNNSSADANGIIFVMPGNQLPTLPRDSFRLRADWSRGPFAVGTTVMAFSSQYSRGNENNADPQGKVPGYASVALDASWQFARGWQLIGRIENLFNTTYETFGILGANYFRGPGNTFNASLAQPEAFRSPAAPFGAWIGVQYRFLGDAQP